MALALDGSAHANSVSATSVAPSLTTTNGNVVVIVVATVNGGPVTGVSDTAGLTWTMHARQETAAVPASKIEIWWAASASALSSDSITVTQTTGAYITVDVFGISGANTSTPFDVNAAVPNQGTTAPRTISTTATNTMIIGGFRFGGPTSSPVAGTGYTAVSGADYQLSEYQIVSSAQSGLSVTVGGGGSGDCNAAIATAVVQAGGATYTSRLALLGAG